MIKTVSEIRSIIERGKFLIKLVAQVRVAEEVLQLDVFLTDLKVTKI